MTNDRDRRSAYGTVGTDDPTRPSEAEQSEAEPMAVANDKTTIHGESFLPSTASLDQYDEEVARRYKGLPQEPLSKGTTSSRKENRAMEDPPGYEVEEETGWKKLKAYDVEDPPESERTAKSE
ncbi:MAG TPA: hypothetical protein VFH78_06050 [Candidatus Thermoplasmatota archaeon]|nr:hypothetical protein [Candidatus Thermoplasmatota archaeon]